MLKDHDNHLMMVIENMINDVHTISHSNTITVIGNGMESTLKEIINQVPVLDMRVYKVDSKNLKDDDVEVHVIYFTSNLLQNGRIIKDYNKMGMKTHSH